MNGDMSRTLDEKTFTTDRQSYTLVHILTVDGSVLRATVKRDFYETQSYARVERFDGTQWHEVVTQPGLAVAADLPSTSLQEDARRAGADKVAAAIIELAARVIAAAR